MIWLTRIDGEQVMLNDERIVLIESSHDTIIELTTGDRMRVLETADEVAERIALWRRRIMGLSLLTEDGMEEA